MNTARLVLAVFGLVLAAWAAPTASAGDSKATVTTAPQGTGSGRLRSNESPNIDCRYDAGVTLGTCTAAYDVGNSVTFIADRRSNSRFGGWASCPGSISGDSNDRCTITLASAAPVLVSPIFVASHRLRVQTRGDGNGSATSTPPGISCRSACQATFIDNPVVTLTAAPDDGSRFAGWGGDCGPAGANLVCSLSLAVNQDVTARFERVKQVSLHLTVDGPGSGSVASSPPGLACSDDCTRRFPAGTTVTLTATPSPGSTFTGWSGACTGKETCSVTLGMAATVQASFKAAAVQASLVRWRTLRTGHGRVTRVRFRAGELVSFTVRIVRGRFVIASRQRRSVQPSQGLVVLRIPKRVEPGKALLQVTFINRFATTKSQNRSVKIPPLG
jgi:Divergent InlB B-repeat domain